ncbi:MAG: AAA domain-containing protein [Planctomycetales bacterium]|nr:AAA domain-containing protein [Planctomycetales bacterium]NIM07781.1 AAA domain-containing protein [Planctomycetales bacterium]NIN07275.1 AAA domain-containing protein [Planctomycetales bacterium]NIN76367.1 AAA domain-containing protein [Planctomycetales bacterium]NIO33576.1 AAA domain-containing protein [Planctomycetales bacterium]
MKVSVLFISRDRGLVEGVQQAVASVSGWQLTVVDAYGQVDSRLGEARLVLAHIVDDADQRAVIQLLQKLRAEPRQIPLVCIGDSHEVGRGIDVLRRGAIDYLTRPVNLRRLALLFDVIRLNSGMRAETQRGSSVQSIGGADPFFYDSPPMIEVVDQVRSVAPLNTTILLSGETGTGKTRLARLIHELSPRREQPFVVIDSGALTPTIVESEMFGHAKGSFTGADRPHEGKFTAVAGGTLMIDEIDALPLTTQAKLLRAVDERVFEPVGSNQVLPLRARIIVATNRSLEDEVAAGRFRRDLYYRVNVVAFALPPLRKRRSLIRPLVDKWVASYAADAGCAAPAIAPQVLEAMEAHSWPGNMRELRNVVERSVALSAGRRIELSDLPSVFLASSDQPKTSLVEDTNSKWLQTKVSAEIHAIVASLERNDNNRARTARDLGISRVTLYKKLHKYGLI